MANDTHPRINGTVPTDLPATPRSSDDIIRSWSLGTEVPQASEDQHGPGTSTTDHGPRTTQDQGPSKVRDRAESKVLVQDAAADREIRTLAERTRISIESRRARRAEKAEAQKAREDLRRAQRAARTKDQQERADLRRARWTKRTNVVRSNADAVLSMVVYGSAVGSAVFGQVSVATGRYGWTVGRSLLLAGFIELIGLAMALTANKLRLKGERAAAPRLLTWVFASFAATVNIWGHWGNLLMAIGLGAASIGGITMWEIRSSAHHRDALRAKGMIAEPMTRFGWRAWIRYFPIVRRAWAMDVLDRLPPTAVDLVVRAGQERVLREALKSSAKSLKSIERSGEAGPALDAMRTYVEDLKSASAVQVLAIARTRDQGQGAEDQVPRTEDQSTPAETTDHEDSGQGPSVDQPSARTTTDQGPRVLTPRPEDCQPRTAKVRRIESGSSIAYLDAVRAAYPDPEYVPTWSEVQRAINEDRTRRGLAVSRSGSTIRRVLLAITAERTAAESIAE